MKLKLTILDGAKGAGKSTVSLFLKEKVENTAFIGLDQVRHLISQSRATNEFNAIAFDVMFAMADQFLANKVNVFIDSGVNQERIEKLRKIAEKNDASIKLYYLSAPKDILWKRVSERDLQKGRVSNEERFNYVYEIQQSKDFSEFIEIDTVENNPENIANYIISDE